MNIQHTQQKISKAEDVVDIFRSILKTENEIDRDKEHFWTIGLNNQNQIKYIELVSLGTLTGSLVHPRETFRMAVREGIASIICCHNHPSETNHPSTDDRTITEKLVKAGEILDIKLLDHIIITKDNYFSFANEGLI